jgi:hypothetical protein
MSELLKINVNVHIEKKNNLSYLSWAWAWAEVLKVDPAARYTVHEFDGLPLVYLKDQTAMVKVSVEIKGDIKTCLLPVLDHRNKPIQNPDSFAVNTSIMRCLAKCIALHGLGLYIYAGEDLPESEADEIEAKLNAEIAACNTVEELNTLYHTLPEAIRSRGVNKFTARKKEITNA